MEDNNSRHVFVTNNLTVEKRLVHMIRFIIFIYAIQQICDECTIVYMEQLLHVV